MIKQNNTIKVTTLPITVINISNDQSLTASNKIIGWTVGKFCLGKRIAGKVLRNKRRINPYTMTMLTGYYESFPLEACEDIILRWSHA